MAKNEKISWEKDFVEFLSAEAVETPEGLSQKVLANIQTELNPSPFKIFGKITFIHLIVGFATLLFCPQFGISLTSSRGIMPYLMKYGDSACMLGCGALFTGLSLLVASFTLKAEEILALKRNEILQLASLTTLSIGVLLFVGGEIAFILGIAWALGAILGAALSLELGWKLRKYLVGRAFA